MVATVPSDALTRWQGERCAVLDSLEAVHEQVTGKKRGRAKLAEVKRLQPLTLATFRSWRGSLNTAASGFDKVVTAYLSYLTGRSAWD
jgi:hypothetical protein